MANSQALLTLIEACAAAADTYATTEIATSAGTLPDGTEYSIDDKIVTFADGTQCVWPSETESSDTHFVGGETLPENAQDIVIDDVTYGAGDTLPDDVMVIVDPNSGETFCIADKDDMCAEPQVAIPGNVDPTDEAAVAQWIEDNGYAENADQVFYFVGEGTDQKPDYVWINNGDGKITETQCPAAKGMCDSGSIKDQQVATLKALTDAGFALQRHTFEPSADDECVPVDPPCPEVPQFITTPDGVGYYWPPGGPWEPKDKNDQIASFRDSVVPATMVDADIAVLPVGSFVSVGTISHEVCNPSKCKSAIAFTVFRQGNIAFEMGYDEGGGGNEYKVKHNGPGGLLTPEIKYSTQGNTGNATGAIAEVQFPPGVGVNTRTLAPGDCYTYEIDIEVKADAYESNLGNRIIFANNEIETIVVCL